MRIFLNAATGVLASLGLSLVGCASHIRTELIATGNGIVTPRAAATEPVAATGGIQLPRGTYHIDLRFGIPRAQRVDWKIRCPGAELAGTVGEPFAEYRERRIKVLADERDRENERRRRLAEQAAAAPPPTTTVVVTEQAPPPPPTTVSGRVSTPIGTVVVRGRTAPPPPPTTVVRTEVHEVAPPPPPPPLLPEGPIELAPGDDGHGILPADAQLTTVSDGTCAIVAMADDANVTAFYSVTRIRDLRQEAAERKQTIYVGAVAQRSKVTAQLVAYGADENALRIRRDAELKARAEAEARRGAELAARRELELRVSLEARRKADEEARLRAQLRLEAQRKADLERKLRLEAEAEQRRIRLEMEARLTWEREAPLRARAELRLRQRNEAIAFRATYIAWLVGECHADPDRRHRLWVEEQRVRHERERLIAIRLEAERIERLRLRAEREAYLVEQQRIALNLRIQRERLEAERRAERDRLRLERERRLLEIERSRRDAALDIRTRLVGNLVAFGGRIRPPRPAPLPETPGAIPFDGAIWTAGHWTWVSLRGEWVWTGGGWRDSGRFGDAGGEVAVRTPPVTIVPVETTTISVDVGTAGYGTTTVRRPPPPPNTVIVRDNRNPPPPPTIVRDHRNPPPPNTVIVRDHRNPPPPPPRKQPNVRDHRDDKDDAKDKKVIVRDHR